MTRIENDWFPGNVPSNALIGESVYLDTSYGFAGFRSRLEPALILGKASGIYNRAFILTGPTGFISVGDYTARRRLMEAASAHPERRLSPGVRPLPVTIEDNVWVGFDSVVLPGVTLGRGSVIGCKVVIDEDVPPYALVVGNPARILRYLHPDDHEAARQLAVQDYSGEGGNNNRKTISRAGSHVTRST